jgi:RNA polymerase sigma-70 factor (ECF subfamily)
VIDAKYDGSAWELDITDEASVAGLRSRDAEALSLLYDRYASQAFALAYRMLANRETAEEVTQDAFMSVWRQAATYDQRIGQVRPWLLSIVRHRAIDRIRRVREKHPWAQLDEAWMKPAPDDVFADVYRDVRQAEIRAALASLPDEQREALELSYFSADTFAEIAEMVGVPAGTVKSRVRLALVKLRGLVTQEVAS